MFLRSLGLPSLRATTFQLFPKQSPIALEGLKAEAGKTRAWKLLVGVESTEREQRLWYNRWSKSTSQDRRGCVRFQHPKMRELIINRPVLTSCTAGVFRFEFCTHQMEKLQDAPTNISTHSDQPVAG